MRRSERREKGWESEAKMLSRVCKRKGKETNSLSFILLFVKSVFFFCLILIMFYILGCFVSFVYRKTLYWRG